MRNCSRTTLAAVVVALALTAPLRAEQVQRDVVTADAPTASWYAFTPSNDLGPSVIGMSTWLDAPAGRHGFIQIAGKDLVFQDGTPVKLWGVGTQPYASGLAPDKGTADALAAWYQKWGVNSVRNGVLFATGWMGIGDPQDTTLTRPDLLDRFDYSFNALKQKGIYYNIVAFWNDPLRPADRSKVLAYDEARNRASLLDTFSSDIQDLHIAATVNFLKHVNPYSGLSYAKDGALACIEIRNEQDVFWYNVAGEVAKCPTYKAAIDQAFCSWLRDRYGSSEKLAAAWAPGTLATGESLEQGTISPVVNAWCFSPPGIASQPASRHRMLDIAAYLYQLQTRYYERFAKAIHETGFQGMVTGSNWQTSGGISHLYNLLTDRAVGRIDRHNYFGGDNADGMKLHVKEDDSSMLWQPGSALLSTGFQQLSDRPFGLTEWMDQAPNEWAAEASPLIAFYGFGLQGWDVAYAGNNTQPAFDQTYGSWLHVQGPLDVGLYPAVARAIYRGDVAEGALIASQHISLADLQSGRQETTEAVAQHGDNKVITSSIPSEALAAGRVAMTVEDVATPSRMPDLAGPIADKLIVSNTRQLAWHYASHDSSYVTVDTAGTKGVFGFAPREPIILGDVTLTVATPFAVVLLTALDRGKTLATCSSALITALARERNTGMVLDAEHRLKAIGTAPILLEPVQATVTLGRPIRTVYLLDHDGRRTARTAQCSGQAITIDGVHDQTMYYEVVFR